MLLMYTVVCFFVDFYGNTWVWFGCELRMSFLFHHIFWFDSEMDLSCRELLPLPWGPHAFLEWILNRTSFRSFRFTLQGTNVSHLGEKEHHLQKWLLMGYGFVPRRPLVEIVPNKNACGFECVFFCCFFLPAENWTIFRKDRCTRTSIWLCGMPTM